MTSLIVSGLAQTALGRSLFARDIRDMRASALGALWELWMPPVLGGQRIWICMNMPFLRSGTNWCSVILKANSQLDQLDQPDQLKDLQKSCRSADSTAFAWQELFPSFSPVLDGTGAPGMSSSILYYINSISWHFIHMYIYIWYYIHDYTCSLYTCFFMSQN